MPGGRITTLPTAQGARTVAIDTKTHAVFLPSANFGAASPSLLDSHPKPPILPDSFFVLAVTPVAVMNGGSGSETK